jgi:hypothetical protein
MIPGYLGSCKAAAVHSGRVPRYQGELDRQRTCGGGRIPAVLIPTSAMALPTPEAELPSTWLAMMVTTPDGGELGTPMQRGRS